MAYIIYNSSGTYLTSVPTGKVNTASTSLTLIGKDVSNYGQFLNQNLVSIMSSFAAPSQPRNPVTGQLWFDTAYQKLKVFNGSFRSVGAPIVSGSRPTGQAVGEFWYDSTYKTLNILGSDGYTSLPAFPRDTPSGWVPPLSNITDQGGNPRNVALLKNYGATVGALTTASFTASIYDSTSTFVRSNTTTFELVAGLTILGDTKVTGILSAGETVNKYLAVSVDLDRVSPGHVATTATVITQNGAIISSILNPMFPTTSGSGIPPGSQVNVLCTYNTSSYNANPGFHIRRFYVSGSRTWTASATTASGAIPNLIF
jgi:hypothetical protein